MALSRGARLGPYEILVSIDVGSMGQDRTVGIKILPDQANRANLRERFGKCFAARPTH